MSISDTFVGSVCPRGMPWRGQWCKPPAQGEKRTDREKRDFVIHAHHLRVARAVGSVCVTRDGDPFVGVCVCAEKLDNE